MSDLVNHARQGVIAALLSLSDAALMAAEEVTDSPRDIAIMRNATSPINTAIESAQHAVLVYEATLDGARKARERVA